MKLATPYIYMLGIQGHNGNWIPMYQPCFTLEEAKRKQRTKKGITTTILKYDASSCWYVEAYKEEK